MLLAACGGPPGVSQIEVTESEWAITLPEGIVAQAGEVTFNVNNSGNLEHNFVIEGAGEIELIVPQGAASLTVTLAPGAYTLVCTLPGHREAGMETQLTVSQ